MPITKTITLYHYHELSGRAKEKAKEWWYECIGTEDYESTIEDAVEVGKCLGIEFDTVDCRTVGGSTRSDPDIRWSGFSSQGDGASFKGTWKSPEWNMLSKVKNYAPLDLTLHSIAQVLHDLQTKYNHKITAVCKYSTSGVSYAHSGWMDVETSAAGGGEDGEDVELSKLDHEAVKYQMRRFADWIYAQLSLQDDYLHSDESVEEAMAANEYTFEENGTRRD